MNITSHDQGCHSERSEESHVAREILRSAQNDIFLLFLSRLVAVLQPVVH